MKRKFINRHIGPSLDDIKEMLTVLGYDSLDSFINDVVFEGIRLDTPLKLRNELVLTESQALEKIQRIMGANQLYTSWIGMGYYDTITPSVIQRSILENPAWYTAYTPYQPEIAQGRLEALFNFQTMVCSMTGHQIANASLLDEGTAAAEGMSMAFSRKRKVNGEKCVNTIFLVDEHLHPQTLDVLKTRAVPLGIELRIQPYTEFDCTDTSVFGMILQNPRTDGEVIDYTETIAQSKETEIVSIVVTDLLALAMIKTPAEMGADIAVGSSQRFGVPMGFGGPHAAFMTAWDPGKRSGSFRGEMPGRIIGESITADDQVAYRMALQTREQHIKRERATSNICTSQVLLAIISSLYAVYHGKEGILEIAERTHGLMNHFVHNLRKAGYEVVNENYFDTIRFRMPVGKSADSDLGLQEGFGMMNINFREYSNGDFGVSFDETTTIDDVNGVLEYIADQYDEIYIEECTIAHELLRTTDFLQNDVFKNYQTEQEVQRYIKKLELKDISLMNSMIPLGSCTMKLNPTTAMLPLSWKKVNGIHPFAPEDQWKGYDQMIAMLEKWLCDITGFDAASLQPNAGSQGEFAGLLAIKVYHESRGEGGRNICLIPASAHGTNNASAIMVGMEMVLVNCDDNGNIDVVDLKEKAELHATNLAAMMVTYPSTHGVFESAIKEMCDIIHANGGQVYMDGANMNAQVGLTSPGFIGADVCHLNLHKTFCIPHGGGGPGVGPICVKEHLSPFLPGHEKLSNGIGSVCSAPFGSASILTISWMYIAMMGGEGLTYASKIAILNANYMSKRLSEKLTTLYVGENGLIAHECIIDLRKFKDDVNVTSTDFGKRLMDYGFHAPTVSFPVNNTIMIEPTESESKAEMDRFIDSCLSIADEIQELYDFDKFKQSKSNNLLKNAPHTAEMAMSVDWDVNYGYTRDQAVYPLPFVKANKFWPVVRRIDEKHGDKNLCTCRVT